MNEHQYEQVRAERPDLFLPPYTDLQTPWRELLLMLPRERLIARRTAVLLSREYPEIDDSGFSAPSPEPELI